MSDLSELEARLAAVEIEIVRLKTLVRRACRARPSYKYTIGSMKYFPEFEEVVRLGRELRKVQRDYAEPE
jgi:hypothetical protein